MSPHSTNSKVLITVCTYNESKSIAPLVQKIRSVCEFPILVIDDSSPDGTGAVVERLASQFPDINLISRSGKLGLGTAILHGLKTAIAQEFDWCLNLDADLSHDPNQLMRLVERADRQTPHRVDLVIGSRYVDGGEMVNCSWRRHLVSRCANFYARLLLRLRIGDCSSAFRCYRISALKQIDLESVQCTGYGMLEEILHLYNAANLRIDEVPITYTERELGDSKISMNEAIGTINALHRLFFRRFSLRR